MNLLFLTPAFPPFPGGGERYAFSLANELIRRGHTITTLTSTAAAEQDFWLAGSQPADIKTTNQPNFQIIRCPLKPLPGGRPALLLWRKTMVLLSMLPGDQSRLLMKMARQIPAIPEMEPTLDQLEQSFDLVHVFNLSWEYPMTAGWRYARLHNLPLVVTPYTHLGVGGRSKGRDRVALNSTMDHQLKILTSASAVLTLTKIEEVGLVALGLQPKQITTIHGGLDRPSPPANPTGVLKQLKLSQPFALYLGRASYDKGAIHAVEAVTHLNTALNTPLLLILAGQSTPEFERHYQKLSSKETAWIRPLGIITDEEKQALLSQTEMLLLPSRADSFGIVLLEAWGYAKPVIGARAGGIPGVIDDGRNGLLVEFGDVPGLAAAIQKLIENPGQKEALGRAGQEKVNDVYRWEAVGERVEAIYQLITNA
jgi:glycosyltransferase involved in cell wall biosynthesis